MVCMKCPEGFYSNAGSIGKSQCKQMRPCKKEDMLVQYGQCDSTTGNRTKTYSWIHSPDCYPAHPASTVLPERS